MEVHRRNYFEGKRSPQLIERWETLPGRYIFYCPQTILEVSIVGADMLRFRYSLEGYFEDDFSYALADDQLPVAAEESYRMRIVGDEFYLETKRLSCVISKSLHIRIFDEEGDLISEDERGFHYQPIDPHGGNAVFCNKKIQKQENFFGLGDKSCQLNLRGMRFENWGSDTYGFEKTSDPLYKAIPFFHGPPPR